MKITEEEKFAEYLSSKGLKFTLQRRLVLEEVFSRHGHFEVDDIVLGLKQKGKKVSRASVYRTLPLLTQSGLLREVHSNEKHSHYEHVFGHNHHDHLICVKCGRIFEVEDSQLEEMQDIICNRLSFKPISHKLEITGLCKECQVDG
jgi:Fur family ferric uptake transcriptional regulator